MTGRKVVFVTTELAPDTPGGAGVVVDAMSRRLADRDVPVVVVLVADVAPAADRVERPGVEVVTVTPTGGFLDRARAAAGAVAGIAGPGDRVEFQDFDGLGLWAIARRGELGLERTVLTVRVHGPLDLLAGTMDAVPTDWEVPRAMERGALAGADAVVAPSRPIGDLVTDRYGLDPDRVVVGEPPVPAIPGPDDPGDPVAPPVFAVVGRLGEMKGSQDAIRAVVALLEEGYDLTLRFIGGDGWSVAAGTGMREWLGTMIPARFAHRIRFEPPVPRDRLGEALEGVTAVLVPSRFESFCLAAHEARALGHAVVVADLPAFADHLGEHTGALRYDGSVAGLTGALRRLVGEAELVAALRAAPLPAYRDPLEVYADDPPVRHEREQAGLGTAALRRVEEAAPSSAGEGALAAAARRLVRILPAPIARVAVRILPSGIKDRFRRHASWPAEEARRDAARRHRDVQARIAAGEFPALDDPAVTVVIPVYDQGAYLWDALASVHEQTMTSFEIVVVDDGSRDPATVALLDGLDLPRVRLVRQENRGLPAARNAGMTMARGRYVVPLDADDELAPGFLEQTTDALEARPDAAYCHCWAELYGDVEAIWVTRPFNPYQQLLSNGVVGCVLLRRDAWEAVGGYDETMTNGNEDWELWVRLMAAGWDQVEVSRPLFRYRRHGVSMSTETEARFEEGRRAVVARHRELYRPRELAARKAKWYPAVSIVTERGGPGLVRSLVDAIASDDAELVTAGSVNRDSEEMAAAAGWRVREVAGFEEAVRSARGKYLLDADAVEVAAAESVSTLVGVLESEPKSAGAATPDGLTLWRAWAVFDPGSDHGPKVTVTATGRGGPGRLGPGSHPRKRWQAPAGSDLPVQRQPPEEDARLPAWPGETS